MNELLIVKSSGTTYLGLGHTLFDDSGRPDGLILEEAVEVLSLTIPTAQGARRSVIISGIDYETKPLAKLQVNRVDAVYSVDDMSGENRKKLKQDYEAFKSQSNMVQPAQLHLEGV